MPFSIYVLLGEGAPAISNASLASNLKHFFRNEEGFSIQFEQLPFAKSKTLALQWGAWLVRVSYKEGVGVAQDSVEIAKIIGNTAPHNLSGINKRIRLVFGTTDTLEHTNQTIYVMGFLREIAGAVIYDPSRRICLSISIFQYI